MAVTQILARISHDRCSACRSDADELDRLLSLQFTRHEEYIDLNWAPKGLLHAAAKIGEPSVIQMLDYLFGGAGAAAVNPDHPEGTPDFNVYSPITSVEAEIVARLSVALDEMDPVAIGEAAVEFCKTEKEAPDDPQNYYETAFRELQDFLGKARTADQTVVSWWD